MSDGRGYFITGTGTGVGKTTVTLGLMQALQRLGHTVVAMKPVAAGCEATESGLRNDDALRLQQAASVELDYALVNPYALAAPVAPQIAAEAAGVSIESDKIINVFKEIESSADCVLIEGAGGWLVPVNAQQSLADVALGLGLPVILVVGLQLGCQNHALLTAASIHAHGCTLAGWVANGLPGDMAAVGANISALESWLGCPLLGHVPALATVSAENVADHLHIEALIDGLISASANT